MNKIKTNAWIILFIVGLAFGYFAFDNIVILPALDPADPDRGWDWLTTDPEIIEYIKFWFRNFGIWVLAVSIFILTISATGYRQHQRWAWYSLLYLPVHILIHFFIWPWLIPLLSIVLILVLAALILPYRLFFPKVEQ
jgi:hypothetical protein